MKIYPRHTIDITIFDLIAGLFSYCTPLNKNKLESDIIAFWPQKKHIKISFTVRTALDSIFSALNFPENSEVIMSAINIRDMVKIVESHRLKVIPVDIKTEDMSVIPENLKSLISEKTKVLIFAQLFGAIIDLKPLSEICTKYNIILIEDCAQGFCGKEYQGSPYSDISLFSFGPIKSCTALGGAIIVGKYAKYIEKIDQTEINYRGRGECWFLFRIVKYLLIKFIFSPRLYGLIVKLLLLRKCNLEKTINSFSRSFPKENLRYNIRFKPPLHMLFLIRRRLYQNLDRTFSSRVFAVRQFVDELGSFIRIPSKEAKSHSFWVVPILTDQPDIIQKKLLQCGFDSTKANHSQAAIMPTEKTREYYIENAKYIMDKIIYLPNIKGMEKEDKSRLISILKSTFGLQGPS